MQQQNIPIATLVDMYKRGELRLPEIQRHYVWRATRVRDLLGSLYRGACRPMAKTATRLGDVSSATTC